VRRASRSVERDDEREPVWNAYPAVEKKRTTELRRGGHRVIPTIVQVALKFAVEVPGMSIAEMHPNLAYAQSLEPLPGAVSALYETLRVSAPATPRPSSTPPL
jgi:hypothetical protein